MKLAAIPVLAVAGVLVGLALAGSDPADSQAEPAAAQDNPTTSAADATGADTSTSLATATSGGDEPGARVVVVVPSELVLVGASAQVVGLGTGAYFSWGMDPTRLTSTDVQLPPIEAESASCALVNPFTFRPDADEALGFDPDGFTTGLRADANNLVSFAVEGDIVTGGFSFGAEGRGDSQQWDLYGGSVAIGVTIGEEPNPMADEGRQMTAEATWSGTSVEGFTGEEASGSVVVTCLFEVPLELP